MFPPHYIFGEAAMSCMVNSIKDAKEKTVFQYSCTDSVDIFWIGSYTSLIVSFKFDNNSNVAYDFEVRIGGVIS